MRQLQHPIVRFLIIRPSAMHWLLVQGKAQLMSRTGAEGSRTWKYRGQGMGYAQFLRSEWLQIFAHLGDVDRQKRRHRGGEQLV